MATEKISKEDVIKYLYYVLYEVLKARKRIKFRFILASMLLLGIVVLSFLVKYDIHSLPTIVLGCLEVVFIVLLIWYIIRSLIKMHDYTDIEALTTRYLRRIDNYSADDKENIGYIFNRYIRIVSRDLKLKKDNFLKLLQERRLGLAL